MVTELESPPALDSRPDRLERRSAAAAPLPAAPWPALAVVLVGVFMAVADFFIVNVALPSIATTLRAGPAALELVVAAYGVAYAVGLVSGGRLGDTLGRRPLFLIGAAGFVLTSAACGLAPTAATLVAARMLQGLSAAAMVPQVLATIQASFVGADRERALGVYGATLGAATVAGQLLGGVLVAADLGGLAWRPAFLVNVPVGLLGLLAAWRVLPDTHSASPQRLDVRGAALLGLAIVALLVPVTTGREMGWPLWSWLCLAAVPGLVAGFAAWERTLERRGGDPLLPPSLLRVGGLRTGMGAAAAFSPAFGGFFFATALSLQQGRHLGPLAAGLVLVPFALAFLVASLTTDRVAPLLRGGVVATGAALMACGYAVLAVVAWRDFAQESFWMLAPAMLVIGAGQGLVVPRLFGSLLSGVPAALAGTASGALMTVFQVGLAVGVGVLGLVFLDLLGAAPSPGRFATATAVVDLLLIALVLTGGAVFTRAERLRESTEPGVAPSLDPSAGHPFPSPACDPDTLWPLARDASRPSLGIRHR
jgi:MFS family permease